MGQPNLRLSPTIEHRVNKNLTELATELLMKCVLEVLPHAVQKKRWGRPPCPLWVIVVLGVLRVVLRVKWPEFDDRIRFSERIKRAMQRYIR